MNKLALSIAAATLAMAFCAPARADGDLFYTVKRGDTLIGLGNKYLLRPGDYRIVQKRNRIINPHAIPIGKVIRMPRDLLKFEPSSARYSSVKGQVSTIVNGKAQSATSGQQLTEGNAIATAGGSFASITLENGSRVSVPSNTHLKILRLRRYILDSALDYDFQVDRGAARSKVVPLKTSNDRYQVRTPKAVSAVRGTDFQTRFDEASARDFAEVDEGALAVGLAGGTEVPVPAGNGLAVNSDGSTIREALLAPIEVEGAGRLQNNPSVRFSLPAPTPGRSSVRLSIARDSSFNEQIADQIVSADTADIGALEDGNYFIRFRAVSENGLEGLPSTYAFKRRLNSVSGSAGGDDSGWKFKWSGDGKGTIRYHFQLFRNSVDGPAFADETGLTANQLILSALPDGTYFWRVGAVQYADGETNTNWTPFEKLVVASD